MKENMQASNFENFIKKSVDQFDKKPVDAVWQNLTQKLDTQPVAVSKNIGTGKILMGLAAGVLLLAGVLWLSNTFSAASEKPVYPEKKSLAQPANLEEQVSPNLVQELFEDELKVAELSGRGLMVYVCMENCVYCARFVDETLSDPTVSQYLEDRFFQITVDIKDPDLRSFFKAVQVNAAPSSIFFTAKGEYISKVMGHRSSDSFLEIMKEIEQRAEQSQRVGKHAFPILPSHAETMPELKIYPNPNTGKFNVQMNAAAEPIFIRIVDESGKEVYQNEFKEFNGDAKLEVDLTDFSKGMYVLQFVQGEIMMTEKVMVKR